MMRVHILLLLFTFLQLATSAPSPKSKQKNLPQTVFDQKQTGDYNIQLHLKDFQIIALLADESLSSLGDYDYNYDYSDFTVKPNNSTQKPTEGNVVSITSPPPPSPSPSPVTESQETSSTLKPEGSSTKTPEVALSTTEKTTNTPNSPDKIKVQIIQAVTDSGHPSIVPSDEIGHDLPALGEIMHYRRCAAGYARDKRGRCRRVRRPSAPFDLSRLASNFASRFRQAPTVHEDTSVSESASEESAEE